MKIRIDKNKKDFIFNMDELVEFLIVSQNQCPIYTNYNELCRQYGYDCNICYKRRLTSCLANDGEWAED